MNSLSHLLENAAEKFPNNSAILHETNSLHYDRLEGLSSKLASHLQDLGIAAGDRVGLWMPKSITAVTAIFGILRAGAAYVPIPESSPPKRTALIASDSGMKILLTDAKGFRKLGNALPDGTCVVELDPEDIEAEPTQSPLPDPDSLAYILYTSGSTGTPKGVMVTHRAALNFINWASDQFNVGPEDKLANLAPLSFDLSVFDIFAAVKAGACVHLISPQRTIFPASLSKYVAEHQLTIWYSVPAVLAGLPQHGQLSNYSLSSLRHILFAGEPFPVGQLTRLMEAVPTARYHNLYGPTESNVVSHYEVKSPPSDELPIGSPCAGHEFMIVNEADEVLSGAATGELLIAGPSLMTGYCNQPEMTADCFRELSRSPRAVAYRTGDLVRRDGEGQYHFAGRMDDMIKHRGYRIEPGEIEAVLSRHPSVSEAVVAAKAGAAEESCLTALVFLHDGAAMPQLADHCAQYLPAYMVPAAISQAKAPLPRNATGKIDRPACTRLLDQAGL